jgi:SAM-dependent methyltransferase
MLSVDESAHIERARDYWKKASGFPADKEAYYPEHAAAQEFDRWGGSDVLEYGCGGGSDALSYMRRGCSVVAVDINPINQQTTSDRMVKFHEEQPGTSHTRFLERSDVIPVGDAAFDVASAHGVLHHIPQPLVGRVVAEIYRVLKPGGWFYAMLYTNKYAEATHANTERYMTRKGISREEAFGWCTDGEGCPWGEPYDEPKVRALVEPAGFQLVSTFVYNTDYFATYRMQRPL